MARPCSAPQRRLLTCLTIDLTILGLVTAVIVAFAESSPYWAIGPSERLIVISVKIHTATRYALLLVLIALVNVAKVIVEGMGAPILRAAVYNPYRPVVAGFTSGELQFYANSISVVAGLRAVFQTMVSITQIDIALWSLVISELVSFVIIRALLREKTFEPPEDDANPLAAYGALDDAAAAVPVRAPGSQLAQSGGAVAIAIPAAPAAAVTAASTAADVTVSAGHSPGSPEGTHSAASSAGVPCGSAAEANV